MKRAASAPAAASAAGGQEGIALSALGRGSRGDTLGSVCEAVRMGVRASARQRAKHTEKEEGILPRARKRRVPGQHMECDAGKTEQDLGQEF